MDFSTLSDCHKEWQDILVIGKTIERDGKKYHILGMTLSDEAKLYIIEPYDKRDPINRKGVHNYRRRLKEYKGRSCCYLHCSEFCLGSERLQTQGGMGGYLEHSDYGTIQLFLDMMSAGWTVPEWLKDIDWADLQLVTIRIADMEILPDYSPDMPITITHRPDSTQHILEKTVTLNVGKSRSFAFTDEYGDNVRKRLIFLRRDNAIFFPHNSSQEMQVSCSVARSKHLTILWRKDNASKSCRH